MCKNQVYCSHALPMFDRQRPSMLVPQTFWPTLRFWDLRVLVWTARPKSILWSKSNDVWWLMTWVKKKLSGQVRGLHASSSIGATSCSKERARQGDLAGKPHPRTLHWASDDSWLCSEIKWKSCRNDRSEPCRT